MTVCQESTGCTAGLPYSQLPMAESVLKLKAHREFLLSLILKMR